jgi:hypothetical protein
MFQTNERCASCEFKDRHLPDLTLAFAPDFTPLRALFIFALLFG